MKLFNVNINARNLAITFATIDFFRSGLDKSRTYVCDVLEIINFTNGRTWLFFIKYTHEHAFYSRINFKKFDTHVL